jgi:hypothetical protein
LIETIFGDGKQHGTLRQLKLRRTDARRAHIRPYHHDGRQLALPKLFAASG